MGGGVAGANHRPEPVRDAHQDLITGGVPQGVVDHLETVEVEEQDGDGADRSRAARERVLDAVAEEGAVGELGQRVVERLVAQLLLERGPRGHIEREGDERRTPVELLVPPADLDVDDPSILEQVPRPPVEGQPRPNEVEQLHAPLAILHRLEVDERHREELLPRVAVELDRRIVDGEVTAGAQVPHPHGMGIALEEQPEALLALAQRVRLGAEHRRAPPPARRPQQQPCHEQRGEYDETGAAPQLSALRAGGVVLELRLRGADHRVNVLVAEQHRQVPGGQQVELPGRDLGRSSVDRLVVHDLRLPDARDHRRVDPVATEPGDVVIDQPSDIAEIPAQLARLDVADERLPDQEGLPPRVRDGVRAPAAGPHLAHLDQRRPGQRLELPVDLAPGDVPEVADARLDRGDDLASAHGAPVQEPEQRGLGCIDLSCIDRCRTLTVHCGHRYHLSA